MNPLAAIRQFVAPEYRPIPAVKPAETAGTGGLISSAEIKSLGANPLSEANPAIGGAANGQFSRLLGNFVSEVNSKQDAASQATQGVLTGQNVSLHQAVIAMEEASVSFQLMVEVRNKLLDSYQELMRMQV
jgi:flagellar hook-basal body complex protein FliE